MGTTTKAGKGRILARAAAVAAGSLIIAGSGIAKEEYRYTVVQGDTLTAIGERLLNRPQDWRSLQKLNRIPDPDRLTPDQVVLIPPRLLRRVPGTALVTHVAGQATGGGVPLARGMALPENVQISTEDNGFVTVRTPDGSVLRLQPRSTLRLVANRRIADTAAHEVLVELKTGRLESDVAKVNGKQGRFEISAPLASVGIRGTRLRVAANGKDSSAVELTEGVIEVRGKEEPRPTTMNAGKGWIADRDHPRPRVRPLLAAPDLGAIPALQERLKVAIPVPPLPGASRYRAQVSADAQFSAIVAEGLFEQPEAKFNGLEDGPYWIRIRGIDGNGLEGLDGQAAFHLKARPEPPFASTPMHGGKAWGETVRFAWSASGMPEYRFQLARDAAFKDLLVDVDSLKGVDFEAPAKLAPGEYFWRVGSVRADGDKGPFGDPQRFTLKPATQAAAPEIGGNEVAFAWSGEPGQTFEFQLAKDEGFQDLLDSRRLDEPRVVLPKPGPGTYFMRVRATDPDGFVGPYSATQRFEVPVPWWVFLAVVVPFL